MVVLLLDEANAMAIQDFLFLKDVSNALDDQGVNVVTILTGQNPDFDALLHRLTENRKVDLISRFARCCVPIPAYKDVDDIKEIFKWIDKLTYPVDSGCTWTQFFFPEAFANGFRMFDQASAFALAIKQVVPRPITVYSARLLFIAIRSFLLQNAGLDCSSMKLSKSLWVEAVRRAQFAKGMSHFADNGENLEYSSYTITDIKI